MSELESLISDCEKYISQNGIDENIIETYYNVCQLAKNEDEIDTMLKCTARTKELINDYEKLLNLKDWYEKISEEANRSYIIESVEKRGHELINQLNLLNAHLLAIQEQHKNLQEQQQKLHHNLLEEHKLLNQYFENYS